jgi:hypothetical protein
MAATGVYAQSLVNLYEGQRPLLDRFKAWESVTETRLREICQPVEIASNQAILMGPRYCTTVLDAS